MTSPIKSSTDPTVTNPIVPAVPSTGSTTPATTSTGTVKISGGGGGLSAEQILEEELLEQEVDDDNLKYDQQQHDINQAAINASLNPLNGGSGSPVDPAAINRLKKLSVDKI